MAEDADEAADVGGDAHGLPHDHSEPVPVTIVPNTEVNEKVTCLYSTMWQTMLSMNLAMR